MVRGFGLIKSGDLEGQIRQVRWRLSHGKSWLDEPEPVYPCKLVLTAKKGSNGKVLVVRCECMAGTRQPPGPRHFAYDSLGEASDLDAVKTLYHEHLATLEVP